MFLKHIRNQDITIDDKFALDCMGLELAIDLNGLLRDRGVEWIGEWDTDGAYFMSHIILRRCGLKVDLTFGAIHL